MRCALLCPVTGSNERTSSDKFDGASFERPAARDAPAFAQRRRDADASAHRSVARPHHRRAPCAGPASAVESRSRAVARVIAKHRLVCDRATRRGRLSALSAGRRPAVAEGLSLDGRKISSRSRFPLATGSNCRPGRAACSGPTGRRSMTGGRGRSSRDWRMSASFRTIFGAAACAARRETRCCAGTVPSTIRRCRKPCCGISRFIAASRQSPARS